MQLARFAVGIFPAEVIDTVCDVRCLLYLSEEIACSDGVETPCWEEIEVALMCLVCRYDILHGRMSVDGFGSGELLVFFWCDALFQTGIDFGAYV